jgi:predicted lipoprotein with Yx(FWY)xxD motif
VHKHSAKEATVKNVLIIVATAVVFVLGGAAIAAAKPAARSATVTTARTALGRIIVDGRGRSLYLFEKDAHGRSACSGVCTAYWPPLLSNGKALAIKGAKPGLLGSIRRTDGSRQVSYAGHPLYFFSGDTRPGQTNGEGLKDFGAGWYVLTPSGKKIDPD